MRKVLFIALFGAAVATEARAQAPVVQVVPVAPATSPATVAPATIQMLDAMRTVAEMRQGVTTIVAPSTIQMLDAMRAVAETQKGVTTIVVPGVPVSPLLEQVPAPAAPTPPPARPAQAAPAPPAAPVARPASAPPAAAPQAPPPPGQPLPAPGSRPPVRVMAPRNVRFDIAITDTGGPKPVTKVVSVTVADNGASGSIRSVGRLDGQIMPSAPGVITPGSFPLNLDVRGVQGYDDGSVRAAVNVEYQPYVPDAKAQPGAITASATAVFQDGRKVQILQSSDPLTDRRTTVEVTATIMK